MYRSARSPSINAIRKSGLTRRHLLKSHLLGALSASNLDDVDSSVETGWSVLVHGACAEIIDPKALEHVGSLGLRQWAPGSRGHWLRIVPSSVSGRAISREFPATTELVT